jgi:hypothetical protein
MRHLLILALLLVGATSAFAQKDQFPLTAKVTASESEAVPTGTSTSQSTATRQHTRIQYGNSITVTAELESKVYRLQSPRLLDPGDYPASIDKGVVRLQVKDKNGKEKTIKLRIIAVAAKP